MLGSRQGPTSDVRAACSCSTPSMLATTRMNDTSTSGSCNSPTNATPPAANNQESPTETCCTKAAASRLLSKVDDAESNNRTTAPLEESDPSVTVPPSVESHPSSSSRTIYSLCAPPHTGGEYPQVASTTDPHSATAGPVPSKDNDTATREEKIELLNFSGDTLVLRNKSIPDFASCKRNYIKGKRRQGRNLLEWDLPPIPKKRKIFTIPPP